MVEHTVRAHREALDALTAEVSRMGELALGQIADALQAVLRQDAALAREVAERDVALDRLEAEIEHDAIRFIALRQPLAGDLRQTLAAFKMAGNLERCGDLAKSIGKRCIAMRGEGEPSQELTRSLERMGGLAHARLAAVLEAYAAQDVEKARRVWREDRQIDDQYDVLFRDLLTCMSGDPEMIRSCAHLLFVAKNLERIGDHATNIAELVVYQVTGEDIALADRPRGGGEHLTPEGAH